MAYETTDELLAEISDHWVKDHRGNLYKLFDTYNGGLEQISDMANKVEKWRAIQDAEGTTLDLIGQDYKAYRISDDDETFRFIIFLHILISRAQGTIPSMVKILGTALDAKPEQFKVYKTGLRHVGIEIPWDNVQTLQMQKFIIKNIQNLLAMGYWIDEIVFYVNVTTTEYIGAASIDETDLNIDVGSSWWTGWEESQQNTEYIATAVTAEDVNMHQVTTTWWTGWQDQQPCESYIGAKPLVIVSYKMIAN